MLFFVSLRQNLPSATLIKIKSMTAKIPDIISEKTPIGKTDHNMRESFIETIEENTGIRIFPTKSNDIDVSFIRAVILIMLQIMLLKKYETITP